MNFEERIQRLTERHEAMAQTLELMMLEHQAWYTKSEERHAKTEALMAQVVESIGKLADIAHLHERRISGLEDRAN